MKIAIALLLSVLAFSSALSVDSVQGYFDHNVNIGMVIDANIGSMNMIASELISIQYNKIKTQYTTFSGDFPAFDIVMDFNEGTMWQYFNLTGDCKAYQIPKMNLAAYLHNLLVNHTEFAGQRGEHLEVYEIKHPELKGKKILL